MDLLVTDQKYEPIAEVEAIANSTPQTKSEMIDSSLLLELPTYIEAEGYTNNRTNKEFALKPFTGSQSLEHQGEGEGHLLTVAPTGTGKGRTAIIPNLLHYQHDLAILRKNRAKRE